ncbi:MAG: tetraacyldisaccharide 4'-kinase [Deltaproteobacteria bacterium]|nr:tetraacyldisaccharide 4'-kinase [Deltaproteobacteria bacterium]
MFEPLLSSLSPFWALTNTVARRVLAGNARRLPKPVISIGNIVAGGVGKTELAAVIAARLIAEKKRVVVASRGYGSHWEKAGGVISGDDAAAAVSLRYPDEALVLLKKAPGVAVAVGADRFAVLTRYWEELHPDVVLLDDGYQHFKLVRDLDILVHDFSVRWPILRDWPGALDRARLRISLTDVPKQWSRRPWVQARYKLTGVVDAQGKRESLPREALAFCGIGNPGRFRKTLVDAGVSIAGFRTFRDHASYGEHEVRELVRWRERTGAKLPLLTTLKDYVKLAHFTESQGGMGGFEPGWVELSLSFIENEKLLWDAVHGAVDSTGKR